MGLIRYFLKIYRLGLNIVFRLNKSSVMNAGEICHISKFNFDLNHGDIVHPCIRYSKKTFKGYNWWLIYTPYYNANPDLENPILCYGESDGDNAPVKWTVFSEIIGKPSIGYNSDPTMFFDEAGLNIFWRENGTPRMQEDNLIRATYGCLLFENGRHNIENPILCEKHLFEDKEVSPAILKFNESYVAYAMHIRFKNSNLHSSNNLIERIIKFPLRLLSILEIYNEQKTFGIAIWKSKSLNEPFKYVKTIKIKNCNKLYRPWHLDVFEHDNKLYAVIQTTQCNADICLAVREDYKNFTMYSKPLITNVSIQKVGIYKPTAFVHKDIFYLYYTAQDVTNRKLNKMYMTSMPFHKLLNKLQ